MIKRRLAFTFDGPDRTSAFARVLARRLTPGDVILLSGDVGAGKTHFARAVIQFLLPVPEEIPSPTFTLVQIYVVEHAIIWHADLYRLGTISEIEELGLLDAFDDAICLVEWPDRLGDLRPRDALDITLTAGNAAATRHFRAEWRNPKWDAKMTGPE